MVDSWLHVEVKTKGERQETVCYERPGKAISKDGHKGKTR